MTRACRARRPICVSAPTPPGWSIRRDLRMSEGEFSIRTGGIDEVSLDESRAIDLGELRLRRARLPHDGTHRWGVAGVHHIDDPPRAPGPMGLTRGSVVGVSKPRCPL